MLTASVLRAWNCAVPIDCICDVVNLDICAEVIAPMSAESRLEILSAVMLVSWSVVKARTCALESAINCSVLRLLICAVEIEATVAVAIAAISNASIDWSASELRLLICVELSTLT